MKKNILLILLVISGFCYAQIPTYYNNVNINLSGQSLKEELSAKVTTTHTRFLSYTPDVWNVLKLADLDPLNNSNVILIYGYNDSDGNSSTDRTRGVNNNGGNPTDWNREHIYPKSLGTPNLGTSGPGSDAHHLRPADVKLNSTRGNRKFVNGSGNSGINFQGYWYPGDEFKGDVARMMMYMYIRYGNRCLPSNVGIGTIVPSDPNMIALFLEWNVEDPVSPYELNRNKIIEDLQGNRNPFIDNPAFATSIWGGPQAEDRFKSIEDNDILTVNLSITFDDYPEETSWEIRNSKDEVVYLGRAYGSQTNGSTINITRKLNLECYSLLFYDTYGDGMCCSNGNGSFELTNIENGKILASGGTFKYQITNNFCSQSSNKTLKTNTTTLNKKEKENLNFEIYPNPTHDFIVFKNSDLNNFNYSIINEQGTTVLKGYFIMTNKIELRNLSTGIYFILLKSLSKNIIKKVILE